MTKCFCDVCEVQCDDTVSFQVDGRTIKTGAVLYLDATFRLAHKTNQQRLPEHPDICVKCAAVLLRTLAEKLDPKPQLTRPGTLGGNTKVCEIESDEDLVLNALTVFARLAAESQKGAQVGFAKGMEFTEIQHFAFDNAKRKGLPT